jgi:hypothetical protein
MVALNLFLGNTFAFNMKSENVLFGWRFYKGKNYFKLSLVLETNGRNDSS